MPRASTKKPRGRKAAAEAPPEIAVSEAAPVALQEPPSDELQPPTTPVEATTEPETIEPDRAERRAGGEKDRIATSLNIAKLQAMSMNDLNQMARELGVENFGTMRKHEVIFHILQKNAERAGVLFSEGVLEVLPEGF